jgi:hypothetical protein
VAEGALVAAADSRKRRAITNIAAGENGQQDVIGSSCEFAYFF